MEQLTAAQVLTLVSKATFKDFDKYDWQAFSGCESSDPRIGSADDYTIILDGDVINIIHEDDACGGQLFNLTSY